MKDNFTKNELQRIDSYLEFRIECPICNKVYFDGVVANRDEFLKKLVKKYKNNSYQYFSRLNVFLYCKKCRKIEIQDLFKN